MAIFGKEDIQLFYEICGKGDLSNADGWALWEIHQRVYGNLPQTDYWCSGCQRDIIQKLVIELKRQYDEQ